MAVPQTARFGRQGGRPSSVTLTPVLTPSRRCHYRLRFAKYLEASTAAEPELDSMELARLVRPRLKLKLHPRTM